ncbi:MAG TPA: hypothetical protein VF101_04400 [Gaiellaceae bacterium]
MALSDELSRVAEAAAAHAAPREELAGILPSEPRAGRRAYLCAFTGNGDRSWLALDAAGAPISSRELLREAVSIAALCELADDAAGGGSLEELRAELATLRLTENLPGIDEAEEAALELERTLGAPPRLASPEHLDAVGAATRKLELALGTAGASPFAEAMKQGRVAIDALTQEVENAYKVPLE